MSNDPKVIKAAKLSYEAVQAYRLAIKDKQVPEPWELISEESKAPWFADAERALQGYTAAGLLQARGPVTAGGLSRHDWRMASLVCEVARWMNELDGQSVNNAIRTSVSQAVAGHKLDAEILENQKAAVAEVMGPAANVKAGG